MHWSDDKHKISWDTHHIHESHTSTSKWRWFFQHPERIDPFGGTGETPDAFFLKRYFCIRTSEIRTASGCFVFTEKYMHQGDLDTHWWTNIAELVPHS